jgi:hypothetical protein
MKIARRGKRHHRRLTDRVVHKTFFKIAKNFRSFTAITDVDELQPFALKPSLPQETPGDCYQP